MSEASDYVESDILTYYLKCATTPGTRPTNVYVSLHSDAAGEAGANEITSTGATRQSATAAFAGQTISGGVISSGADLEWTNGSGGSWTVDSIGVWDNASHSTGNLLFYTPLTGGDVTVADGDTFKVSSGNLTVTVA
jgi:hypothetical protein